MVHELAVGVQRSSTDTESEGLFVNGRDQRAASKNASRHGSEEELRLLVAVSANPTLT